MNLCAACALAGTALCLHLVALEAHEAAHPPQSDARPAVAAVMPLKPDDDHRREFETLVRIVDTPFADVGSGEALPPGQGNTLDTAVQVARRAPSRLSPSLILTTPLPLATFVETLPPSRFVQTTSS